MNINRSHNFNPWQIAKRIHPAQLKAALVLTVVCLVSLALLVARTAAAAGGGITHLMM